MSDLCEDHKRSAHPLFMATIEGDKNEYWQKGVKRWAKVHHIPCEPLAAPLPKVTRLNFKSPQDRDTFLTLVSTGVFDMAAKGLELNDQGIVPKTPVTILWLRQVHGF